MDMQVVYFLAAFSASIGDDAETTLGIRRAALLCRQLWRQRHHAPQQPGVLWGNLGHRRDMRLGNHEKVHRRPGMDVVECEDFLVFIDLAGRNLAGNDLAKKAVRIVHGGGMNETGRSRQITDYRALNDSGQAFALSAIYAGPRMSLG